MKNMFYFSKSFDAYDNIALDEYFLNSVKPGELVLYLYVNESAVIIGCNQNPWRECAVERMELHGVQLSRRCSGGGAVYHDRGNLNFSFIAGEGRYSETEQTGLLMQVLRSCGISAGVSGRNDIQVGNLKFSGNAYCSRGSNRLRHGTVLIDSKLDMLGRFLTPPAQKLEAKGVTSVRARVCNLRELCPWLTVNYFADSLKTVFNGEELNPADVDREAIEALRQKHSSTQWRFLETPQFNFTLEERFPWGMAQLYLDVQAGVISSATLHTDANDSQLPIIVSAMLIGKQFQPEEVIGILGKIE